MKNIFAPSEMLAKLRTRLAGMPKNLIKGLTDEDTNYGLALHILDNRYQVPGRDAKALVEALVNIPPMMGDSLSTQEVFSCYLAMKQRLSGMGLSDKDKCFIYETVLLERKFNNTIKKYWFDKIRETASDVDKIGSRARDTELEKVVMDRINYLTTLNGDQNKCQENKKKRAAMKANQNQPKPREQVMITQTSSNFQNPQTMAINQQTSNGSGTCPYCEKSHSGWFRCSKRPKDPATDLNLVRSKKRCYGCLQKLSKDHFKSCQMPKCTVNNCGKRHQYKFHKLLTAEAQQKTNPQANVAQVTQTNTKPASKPIQRGLLRTLKCWIIAPDGA